jgi:hypothetical protein
MISTVKQGKNKFVGNEVITTVDERTGEIIETEVRKKFVSKVQTDNFFMCFFENFAGYYNIKHLADMKLIAAMCELAEFNTGVVHMTKKTRQIIHEKTGISLSNISRNLNRLKDLDLIAEDEGDYTINPAIFWKGSTTTRTEILKSGEMYFEIKLVEAT